MNNLTIRSATAADTAALARLAALDSRPVPTAPVFVAELDDRLIAAVSARDGAAVADPFTRSATKTGAVGTGRLSSAARRTRAAVSAAVAERMVRLVMGRILPPYCDHVQ